jgi:hypothetical protein
MAETIKLHLNLYILKLWNSKTKEEMCGVMLREHYFEAERDGREEAKKYNHWGYEYYGVFYVNLKELEEKKVIII